MFVNSLFIYFLNISEDIYNIMTSFQGNDKNTNKTSYRLYHYDRS